MGLGVMSSALASSNVAAISVIAGFCSFSNSSAMRVAIWSVEPIWVKVPRPISAALVMK